MFCYTPKIVEFIYLLGDLHAAGPYVTVELVIDPLKLGCGTPAVCPNPIITQFKLFPLANSLGLPDTLI